MAQVIAFDRRATHRIVSDPSVLDHANDVDALIQRAITYLEPAGILALGYNDPPLYNGIRWAHDALQDARAVIHEGLDLYAGSIAIDPYSVGNDAA